MKARSLVSCILLSTLVFLLLSIAVQATEYREVNKEVKADDILKHIENGEDINLTGCSIVGELNLSEIKLKKVPNPNYNERLNEGWSKEELIFYGINENICVIESNIKIKNSIFENSLKFSGTIFNAPTDFSESTFNASADFSGSTFSDSADFFRSTFLAPANFSELIFNAPADFSESIFNAPANFTGSTFNASAAFIGTTFNAPTYFSGSIFNDSAQFIDTTFNAPTYFSMAPFDNYTIENYGTVFDGSAQFMYATFNASADFSVSTFNDSVDFSESIFNDSADFKGPHQFKIIITSDEKTCNLFRLYYRNEARFVDADNIYYNFRKHAQHAKDLISFSKWTDILSWITCGYGLKPLNALGFGGLVILLFSFIYEGGQGIYRSSDAEEKKSKVSGLDAMLFSIREFTTLGSADWYPKDNFRILVTLEGLLGYIMLGIFMATLTAMMIRS